MIREKAIEDDILRRLSRKGRGQIFFAQRFYDKWQESSVRFTLSEMAKSGKIARLARGVYCYPKLTEHGMKMIIPDADAIARAVAKKAKVRIAPYGDHAAYLVGLTGLLISSTTYITDGVTRRIRLSGGRDIVFIHTSELRIFAFTNEIMQLISNAVRAIGKDRIGDYEREVLKWRLDSVPAQDFAADLMLCPEWVRDLLLDLKVN